MKQIELTEEPEFVLPEKWGIKLTEENAEVLGYWREDGHFPDYTRRICSQENYYILSNYRNKRGYCHHALPYGYKEITLEQFEKYVLKSNKQQSLLESKKETMKTEFKDLTVPEVIKKGDLVENNNNIMIVTKVVGIYYDCTVVHKKAERSYDIGDIIQQGIKDIKKVKGILTLTQ